ncbi:MAG: His/Gly/Thr/Pro-type tRNA ligase C-terminal domain-containing protein [Candidatus Pacebacteria bacterium]|nr:His/Gly/Thr/Pro-type tRNA ligase C-terminal domain-containing protein [Candidatus Paceibacterota bacterium]
MRDTRHENTAAFLGSAIKIAEYYGFVPLEDALKSSTQAGARKSLVNPKAEGDISFARREERALAQIARRSAQCMRGETPETGAHMFWRTTPGQSSFPSISLELHVAGARGAIAEALLLIVASTIAEEAGLPRPTLSINNIGSMESSNRFVRDVGTYLRKHLDTISPTLRPKAATDPLGTLVQLIEKGHPAIARAPQAMEYLTEDERRRFWELLEYLEVSGLSYELSPHILGSRDCWAHSLYELSTMDNETNSRIPVAFGGRYDPLASRFGGTAGAATISITCEVKGKTRFKHETPGVPAIYFAHLGIEARRASLKALDVLRRAEIPVYHSLCYEKIGEQMTQAKTLAAPYVLIVGYKEAMDSTVMVREVATNSQESIPLPELPGYLKRRRVGNWKGGVAA